MNAGSNGDPDSETAGVPAYRNISRDEDTLARASADQRDVHDHVYGPDRHLDCRAVDRTRIWIQSDCDRYCLQRFLMGLRHSTDPRGVARGPLPTEVSAPYHRSFL